ncbi:MAG: ArsR/SmtB family transcription factor [Microbacteriaceae bacterium]
MADIFSVVADSTRRDILFLLLERARAGVDAPTAPEVTRALGLSAQGVNAHLKSLTDNGFITVRGEGTSRTFEIDSEPLHELAEWLLPFLEVEPEADIATDIAGATVFAAWSGSDAGDSLGRAISDRSHKLRVAVESAAARVATVLPETITKRLPDRP